MSRFPVTSIEALFAWKESEVPPETSDSEVVRFFAFYLSSRWAKMFAKWRDFPRYPPEMVIPGYQPDAQDELMEAACPGDHDRWAGALMGLYTTSRNERLRRELNVGRMTESLAELNREFRKHGGRLSARYINSGIPPSRLNGDAYKALLLSRTWRTMTAAKQASGTWKNPSWEMFSHWVKLVGCAGFQRHEVAAPQAERVALPIFPTKYDPIRDWRDRGGTPPFVDPDGIAPAGPALAAPQVVDKNVYEVYNKLCTEEPKVDLGGYSDITPARWESYAGWAQTPIKPDIVDVINETMPRSGQFGGLLQLPWLA